MAESRRNRAESGARATAATYTGAGRRRERPSDGVENLINLMSVPEAAAERSTRRTRKGVRDSMCVYI